VTGQATPSAMAPKKDKYSARKIVSLDRLEAVRTAASNASQSIVLAHGVFDLLHIGHIRHLRSAASQGDMLVVSITGDQFVNKGPGRPVFTEQLRAEMLAALDIVDWVVISQHPTSEKILGHLKPDVYVKGPDYKDPKDDATGKIQDEREAVERHGGRLVITDDVVFSSSHLVNRHFDWFSPEVREFLDKFRRQHPLPEILDCIESVSNLKVLVIGETIIDEYSYVEPLGKSAKENMIATLAKGGESFAGGVIAAANHIAGLCGRVDVVTLTGDDPAETQMVRENLLPQCGLSLIKRPGAPTTRKTRYIDAGSMRKLFEVYHMDDTPLEPDLQAMVDRSVTERLSEYDLVVVTDFGHGMIASSTIAKLMAEARFLAVNTQTNSANTGFNLITRYPRADYICIDAPEARLAVGNKFAELQDIAAGQFNGRVDCPNIVLTRGRQGCVSHDARSSNTTAVPAFATTVVDTVGAGDAFFAVTAPFAALRTPMDLIGFLGNVAGGIKVGIVGHRRPIEKVSLVKAITALMK
jgi:rfaE bifunctional protein nucleotidyltransferase chain/domain